MKAEQQRSYLKFHQLLKKYMELSCIKSANYLLAYEAMGLLESKSFYTVVAAGLVETRAAINKHATKQIDRLLSNKGISVRDLSEPWVNYVLGEQKEVVVALDWTSFFDGEQSMLILNVVTGKGLATPLLRKSVDKNS
jgi:hypothetical protein